MVLVGGDGVGPQSGRDWSLCCPFRRLLASVHGLVLDHLFPLPPHSSAAIQLAADEQPGDGVPHSDFVQHDGLFAVLAVRTPTCVLSLLHLRVCVSACLRVCVHVLLCCVVLCCVVLCCVVLCDRLFCCLFLPVAHRYDPEFGNAAQRKSVSDEAFRDSGLALMLTWGLVVLNLCTVLLFIAFMSRSFTLQVFKHIGRLPCVAKERERQRKSHWNRAASMFRRKRKKAAKSAMRLGGRLRRGGSQNSTGTGTGTSPAGSTARSPSSSVLSSTPPPTVSPSLRSRSAGGADIRLGRDGNGGGGGGGGGASGGSRSRGGRHTTHKRGGHTPTGGSGGGIITTTPVVRPSPRHRGRGTTGGGESEVVEGEEVVLQFHSMSDEARRTLSRSSSRNKMQHKPRRGASDGERGGRGDRERGDRERGERERGERGQGRGGHQGGRGGVALGSVRAPPTSRRSRVDGINKSGGNGSGSGSGSRGGDGGSRAGNRRGSGGARRSRGNKTRQGNGGGDTGSRGTSSSGSGSGTGSSHGGKRSTSRGRQATGNTGDTKSGGTGRRRGSNERGDRRRHESTLAPATATPPPATVLDQRRRSSSRERMLGAIEKMRRNAPRSQD